MTASREVLSGAEPRSERIRAVCARVRELAGPAEGELAAEFVLHLLRLVPEEDLRARELRDLAGGAFAAWRMLAARRPGETVVRMFDPRVEPEGWQSPHTIIQLVSADMPFIVDTVTMELARAGCPLHLALHAVIRLRRDHDHRVQAIVDRDADAPDARGESVMHIEIDRETDPARRDEIRQRIERALAQVAMAVEDWQPMRAAALHCSDELAAAAEQRGGELAEAAAFLRWLTRENFIFLGYREYGLRAEEDAARAELVPDGATGLGILRGEPRRPRTSLAPGAAALARDPTPLVLTKANSRSPVHRNAYLDYVGVKRFDPDGRVVGERRFLGLYTSAAYRQSARETPLLAAKVRRVLDASGFPPDSHDAKALLEILESHPRDVLFQARPEELYEIAMGVLELGERQRVRLFARRDRLGRFVECLVCLPREAFNTTNRMRMMSILAEALGGTQVDYTVQATESVLARVHFIVRCPNGIPDDLGTDEIERRLADAVRGWQDRLREALDAELGPDRAAELAARYGSAFPPGYRDEGDPASAVADIAQLEALADRDEPIVVLGPPGADEETTRCKLYTASPISLSEVLPTFERLGASVIDERPYAIAVPGQAPVWIYDFGLRGLPAEIDDRREQFEAAFLGIRRGELEDDGLGALVLRAGLDGREVTIVRAIAHYLRQAGIQYSNAYMERTLVAHADVARMLVELFAARLDPDEPDPHRAEGVTERITHAIDEVQSLDEDRILRGLLSVVMAVLRTNYFRTEHPSDARPCLAFKLDPEAIELLPQPRPRYEIFVYSPQVEGIHLRGGRVARGGLRWSDRPEDFRTEVLGLMKAQMVKNALIVPVGSKGGFVVKCPPAGDREALTAEAIACYRTFLAGLLDLTDNIVSGRTVPPPRVVRHDGDDPYLVVAADKGTASFSDIANDISADYGFWLGDAFASGGSHGYDHKRMGITARGAWESVRRHFRELGTDSATEDFTVVGIGDMSGDVFGNGMLLSRHIRLVAAFNHRHVFIDPDPDPDASFEERRRLFELAGSGWDDYDRSRLSEGGGIYERAAKRIPISEAAGAALGIDARELAPPDLIRELLKAPVDLLWNGGIGTYVKAAGESNADVGDKAGDAVRIDARELRCRVVGEGGNLGFTQRGRIEYAQAGGRINTDAIDNVAGVNCSDHEVNIKILLDSLVAGGELTRDERNDLLEGMTDAVSERVIAASRSQTQALSLELRDAVGMLDVHGRLIRQLEQRAGLRRRIEFLPTDEEIAERAAAEQGLTSPELAVLMAHAKIHLYAILLESDLPDDPYLAPDLESYFPDPLPERFAGAMQRHRLRREIVATRVANELVDRAGSTYAFRLREETGAAPAELARAYAVAAGVFEMGRLWSSVEALDDRVPAAAQLDMLLEARRLAERSARWLLRANPRGIDVSACADRYAAGVRMLRAALPELLAGEAEEHFERRRDDLREAGVPEPLARFVAAMPVLLPSFDIVGVAGATERDPELVMHIHFGLGRRLELDWLRERIIELPRGDRWTALARAALRDDLQNLHRGLTTGVLRAAPDAADAAAAIETWSETVGDSLERALRMIEDIRATRHYDTTTLPVALRELRSLTA
jgi:glutamate dehydrogenase